MARSTRPATRCFNGAARRSARKVCIVGILARCKGGLQRGRAPERAEGTKVIDELESLRAELQRGRAPERAEGKNACLAPTCG